MPLLRKDAHHGWAAETVFGCFRRIAPASRPRAAHIHHRQLHAVEMPKANSVRGSADHPDLTLDARVPNPPGTMTASTSQRSAGSTALQLCRVQPLDLHLAVNVRPLWRTASITLA
jgi:hypothetical protein